MVVPLSQLSHPPQHQTKEKPIPWVALTRPGLYIQWFSAVLWLSGPRGGEVAHQSQLDSGSDLGLLVPPGTHSLCLFFFNLKDSTQPNPSKATAQAGTLPPKRQKLKKLALSISPSGMHASFLVSSLALLLGLLFRDLGLSPRSSPQTGLSTKVLIT